MSEKIVLTLGGNALGDDLIGQMKAIKITSQAIIDLVAQEHRVVVTHSNGLQVDMINQAFEAAAKTEAHSPTLPMSVCVILNRGYIGCDLQNALGEELLSRGINKPVATLVIQVEVDANDPAFLSPIKSIDSFFTEQEAEPLTKQGYTLKGDAGRSYRHVITPPKPVDIIEKKTVKVLVDAGQVVVTVGGDGIPVIREDSHLRGANAVIDKGWISARSAETIGVDMLIVLTAVEKVTINFGKENEQWLGHLSLSNAKCFIEEDHFAGDSVLPKMEATALFARSCTGRETLITVLNEAREGIEDKAEAVICQ